MARVYTKDGRWIDIPASTVESSIFTIVDGMVCIEIPDETEEEEE